MERRCVLDFEKETSRNWKLCKICGTWLVILFLLLHFAFRTKLQVQVRQDGGFAGTGILAMRQDLSQCSNPQTHHCSTSMSVQRFATTNPSISFKKNGYDHRGALFGTIPYGTTIQQQVYYAGSILCSGELLHTNAVLGRYPLFSW